MQAERNVEFSDPLDWLGQVQLPPVDFDPLCRQSFRNVGVVVGDLPPGRIKR